MVALKPLLLPQQLEPRFVTTKRRLEDYRTPPASPRTTETNMMYKEYDGTISLVSPPVTPTGAEYQSPRAFHPFTPPGHYNSDESCHSSRSHFFTKGTELSDLVEEPAELDVDDEQLRLNTTGNNTTCFPGGHVTILAPLCGQLELPRVYSSAGTYSEFDANGFRPTKKRRGGESPFAGLATRLTDRFPVFVRRWKTRRHGAPRFDNGPPSWTQSYRGQAQGLPPTPATSSDEDEDDDGLKELEGQTALDPYADLPNLRTFSRSPLLPPIITQIYADPEPPAARSPLEPPSVATDLPRTDSSTKQPDSSPCTQRYGQTVVGPCGPTPPLSARPSFSSLSHHQAGHSSFTPSDDLPLLVVNDTVDEWTEKLGHANFSIHPEPHKPEVCNGETLTQLKLNWEVARCNFARHLFRVGEHYGLHSSVYRLTQEKWAGIHAEWLTCMHAAVRECKAGGASGAVVDDILAGMDDGSPVVARPPAIDYRMDSKFPRLGDEDIVGPMEKAVAATRVGRRSSKRAAVFRFLRDI